MIIDFTVSNFRSIKESQTFSLFADKPGLHLVGNIAFPVEKGVGVLKSAGIYGSNASGKTNLLLAFEALQYLVRVSGFYNEGDTIGCYDPFLLSDKGRKEPVYFEIEFFTPDSTRYLYKIAFTRERIVEEQLSFFPSTKAALLFERRKEDSWETIKFGTLFTGGRKRIPFFSNNAYLSKAGSSADAPEMIRKVYNFLRNDIMRLGLNEKVSFLDWVDDESALNKISSLLSFVDSGVSGVVVKESDVDMDMIKIPEGVPSVVREQILRDMRKSFQLIHVTESKSTELFPLEMESAGTQKLFHLAPLIVNVLSNGGVLIIDELDNSMHPFMADLIIRLFNDPAVNKGNAQLIFSTHNITLMSSERFRRDQIWFTEKINGATSIYSLDDFDKNMVKPQSPFNKWYAEGRFGAVPKIDYLRIVELLNGAGVRNA